MPRESYYQDVGNPTQRDQLPSRPLTQAFPAPEPRAKLRALSALKVMGGVLAMDVLDFATRHESCAADFVTPRAIAIFAVSITFIVICAHSITSRVAKVGYFVTGVLTSSLTAVAFATGINSNITWIHIGVIAAGYLWLFAMHWTERCIASPIDREVATTLRGQWLRVIVLRSLLAAIVIVVSAMALPATAAVWSNSLSIAVALILIYILTQRGYRVALVSWGTYNINETDASGVLQSPAGRCGTRTAAIVAMCFVITSCLREAFAVPVLLPSLLALSLPGIFLGTLLQDANTYRRTGVTPDRWRTNISNLRTSTNPVERKSYYIASVLSDNSPVLLPRDGLIHCHFLGDTGGGKTSLGLLPFIEQTIDFGDASVVVIDLKADKLELMSTMVSAAKRLKSEKGIELPLKYLSTRDDYSCFALNPMTQPFWKNLSSYQKTDLLTAAAGLQYGTEYGAAFYDSTNAAVINETFKRFPDVQTFHELAERCDQIVNSSAKGGLHAEVRKNGIHALEVVKRLASFPPLNVSKGGGFPEDVLEDAIDLADVFRRPQMMYFHLNSTLSPGAAPALARFVTFFLLAAAGTVERTAPVYLVIDEFQRMAAANFESMLQLARSMNVHIILANQSMEDLKNSRTNLIPTIEANCGFRQWFSVTSSDDRRRLVEASGQTVEYFTSTSSTHSSQGGSTSTTVTEQLLPRISTNDIALMSDHMLHSIVSIARGSGYAQYGGLPFICRSDFHISKHEYDRRQRMPWPGRRKGTFIPDEWMDHLAAGTTSKSGPQITTEIIGDSGEDPFASFLNDLQGDNPPKRKPGKRRRRK